MKKLSKILSVGLSLVMCASLVAPSFAASFGELQGAIDTGESVYKEDGTTYKIEASKDDDTGAVNVKLYEEVKYESGDPKTITVKKGADVTIDLNGNDIDAQKKTGAAVITINGGGELTLTDSTATGSAEEGTYESGAITGGTGGGVYNAGTFTMESGSIAGNTLTGGYRSGGGGVNNSGGTFTMEDGTISGNTAYGVGGGVSNTNGGTVTMNGGAITNNTAAGRYGEGGGVYNINGTFNMTNGVIEGNRADDYGGGMYNDTYNEGYAGVVKIEYGVIKNNTAGSSAGGVYNDGTFIMEDGTIEGNKGKYDGDDIFVTYNTSRPGSTLILPEDSLWDLDEERDRNLGVRAVYSGKTVSRENGTWVLRLKNHVHHFTNMKITKEPTCTEAGEVVYSGGCICGQTVIEPIEALGHDMGEWVVTKEPSPGVKGEETSTCQREGCNHTETRSIPALPVDPTNPTNPTDPTDPTDPTNPTDPTDPTVEVDEPDVPLSDLPEGPDEGVEIDEPDVPLAELPEASDETVEIDGPDVPLSNVPQTGEASTMMFVVVLLACGMGLVYVNTGKRKDNA